MGTGLRFRMALFGRVGDEQLFDRAVFLVCDSRTRRYPCVYPMGFASGVGTRCVTPRRESCLGEIQLDRFGPKPGPGIRTQKSFEGIFVPFQRPLVGPNQLKAGWSGEWEDPTPAG